MSTDIAQTTNGTSPAPTETKKSRVDRVKAAAKSFEIFAPSKNDAMAINLFDVKDSLIECAGQGVYSKIDIPSDVNVLEYTGVWREEQPTDKGDEHNGHQYCFQFDDKTCIDATGKKVGGLGRYVNDVHGTKKRTNLEWHICKKLRRVFMKSTRPIKRGAELYISYGVDFWKYQDRKKKERERRLKKKAKRTAKDEKASASSDPVSETALTVNVSDAVSENIVSHIAVDVITQSTDVVV